MMQYLRNVTEFFFPGGQDLDGDIRRKYTILIWLCIVTGLNYTVTFLILSPFLTNTVLIIGIIGAMISFTAPLLLRAGLPFFWVFQTFLVGNLLCYLGAVYLFGGSTTTVIVWMCAFPLFAIILTDWRQAIVWACISGGVTLVLASMESLGYITPSNILQPVMPIVSFTLVLFFTITVIIFYFLVDQVKNRLMSQLKEEKQKSDSLLLNILPEEVANEIKAKGMAEARVFDHVSVLFTDFVEFTQVSERLGPQQLVDELHACFKGFDEIISINNVEKIKTVGDAYIAVSGLPIDNPSHAENIVKAALEMQSFIQNRKKHPDYLGLGQIRIGIHSGSVVAGIVGVKKFAYDIWGDAVNTAARMEQTCDAGKVNISEVTYTLVKDKFQCKYRGEIEAKNKGKLKMYFVEGARDEN